ncbi:acyl-CoA reductase [Jatrophihabitans sp.]|uniref:acyl-CoA reductase n=1 Tax=Jatrophihabitans sp. TaxID=1932789 RepID=UPI0038CDC729
MLSSVGQAQLADALRRLDENGPAVVRAPGFVRGLLRWPDVPPAHEIEAAKLGGPPPWRVGDTYLVPAHAGPEAPVVALPYAAVASQLVEPDTGHLARCLYATPVQDVWNALGELGELLDPQGAIVATVTRMTRRLGIAAVPGADILWRMLASVFEPESAAAAVDAELGHGARPGRAYLDNWVPVDGDVRAGATARLAQAVFARPVTPVGAGAGCRAVPTRQLHITPTNTPLAWVASLVRGLTVKGSCLVKVPAEYWPLATAVALALSALGPHHPLASHTSLGYWRGGDRAVEDVLLAPDAFDRVVVWGGGQAIADVRSRTSIRTVLFEPRAGVTLLGRGSFGDDVDSVAERAAVDSLVEDQAACTSSLVHYVEADEAAAVRYCGALQRALARWDAALPPRPAGRALLRLRRGALIRAQWFVNGDWPAVTSAVALVPHRFDLGGHPGGRCVVVRRVEDLSEAVEMLDRGVSAVGVHPEQRWRELRDQLAARGVTTVTPVGQTERRWPGMPHDGMRILSELVSWTVC